MATTTFIPGNNVNTTLAAAVSATATTLTLSSSANLPTLSGGQQMALTLNDAATGAIFEVVYATNITGATLTVLRGQEGTIAQNWNIGDFAFCAPTAGTVAQVNGNPANQFQVATAAASNQAVPLAQAQGMRGTYNGSIPLSTSTTLTSSQIGAVIYFFGSTASQTLTLPAASSLVNGEGYTFSNFASVPVTVARSGSDLILAGPGVSAITLQPGDDLEIETANNTQWIASGSSVRQFNPLVIGAATAGNQAAQLGQVLGKQQFITSSSNFSVPVGVTQIFVTAISGGGGGGGGGGNGSSGAAGGGGGGGQGQQIYKQTVTVAPGQIISISIGAGGTAGTAGGATGTAGGPGGNGGFTTIIGSSPSISISCIAGAGGSGAIGNTGTGITAGANGGVGGTSSAGGGAAGFAGTIGGGAAPGVGGAGGGSVFGPGGLPTVSTTGGSGSRGLGFGSGGSGGTGGSGNPATGGAGGAGVSGAVLIEW